MKEMPLKKEIARQKELSAVAQQEALRKIDTLQTTIEQLKR